jgi:hypothetical protein
LRKHNWLYIKANFVEEGGEESQIDH